MTRKDLRKNETETESEVSIKVKSTLTKLLPRVDVDSVDTELTCIEHPHAN